MDTPADKLILVCVAIWATCLTVLLLAGMVYLVLRVLGVVPPLNLTYIT